MSDYLITLTDPAKDEFVIKPWTTNGPITPSDGTLPPTAVAANTSLNLLGKGKFEYGEIIQENLVRMMEHFSYVYAPVFAIEGQLWHKNTTGELFLYTNDGVTTDWRDVFVSGINTTDLDANGIKITNIGDATNPTDVVNLQTADLNYVNVAGDTMTDFLTLSADPVNPLHAATRQFVEDTIAGASGFVNVTGDTMTGRLIMQAGGSPADGGIDIQSGSFILSGSGTFNGGGKPLLNITTTTSTSAANKGYVDGRITDTNIISANYDGAIDKLTLTKGNASTIVSNTIIENTIINNNPSYTASYLRENTYPDTISIPQALALLDSAANASTRRIKRYTLSNSTLTNITLPFKYHVETDRLQVFKNGSKLSRANRAVASIVPTPTVNCATALGNIADVYSYAMTVDGATYDDIMVDLTTLPNTYGKKLAETLTTELNQKGYQTITFSSPLVDGTELTGFAPDNYMADITIDGVLSNLIVDCTLVTTINDFIVALNDELPLAHCFLYDGKIVVQSNSRGPLSTVFLDDSAYSGSPENQLITSLTNFSSIDAAVNGYNIGSTYGQQTTQFSVELVDGSEPTGLAANNYQSIVTIDGTSYSLLIEDGSLYSNINDIIDYLNVELQGVATSFIFDGKLVIQSNTLGFGSTVVITDTAGSPAGILSSLTNFSIIDAAVDGVTGVTIIFEDDSLLVMSPTTGNTSEITISSATNGSYLLNSFTQSVALNNQTIGVEPWDFYEDGTPLQTCNSFTLVAPLIISDTIEVLLLPGWIL